MLLGKLQIISTSPKAVVCPSDITAAENPVFPSTANTCCLGTFFLWCFCVRIYTRGVTCVNGNAPLRLQTRAYNAIACSRLLTESRERHNKQTPNVLHRHHPFTFVIMHAIMFSPNANVINGGGARARLFSDFKSHHTWVLKVWSALCIFAYLLGWRT